MTIDPIRGELGLLRKDIRRLRFFAAVLWMTALVFLALVMRR